MKNIRVTRAASFPSRVTRVHFLPEFLRGLGAARIACVNRPGRRTGSFTRMESGIDAPDTGAEMAARGRGMLVCRMVENAISRAPRTFGPARLHALNANAIMTLFNCPIGAAPYASVRAVR